jgi:hypothetical protein
MAFTWHNPVLCILLGSGTPVNVKIVVSPILFVIDLISLFVYYGGVLIKLRR